MPTFCATWPKPFRKIIIPVFIPFKGCPSRCIYCNQEIQTGISQKRDIEKLLTGVMRYLRKQPAQNRELAFYGGTFTGLKEEDWNLCLEFARKAQKDNLIVGFRCSTRPDFLSDSRLFELAQSGCELVELGIQSFSKAVLVKSGRGYDPETCIKGVEKILSKGMMPGVQLLPGLPDSTGEIFLNDVKMALELGVKVFRFYPCLVLAGTPLADLFASGDFIPWSLLDSMEILAKGVTMAVKAGARVIRIGLANTAEMEKSIIAGPYHPSLGGRVMARALLAACRELITRVEGRKAVLRLPVHVQGCFTGWKNELLEQWRIPGIRMGAFRDDEIISLEIYD